MCELDLKKIYQNGNLFFSIDDAPTGFYGVIYNCHCNGFSVASFKWWAYNIFFTCKVLMEMLSKRACTQPSFCLLCFWRCFVSSRVCLCISTSPFLAVCRDPSLLWELRIRFLPWVLSPGVIYFIYTISLLPKDKHKLAGLQAFSNKEQTTVCVLTTHLFTKTNRHWLSY